MLNTVWNKWIAFAETLSRTRAVSVLIKLGMYEEAKRIIILNNKIERQ